MHIQFPASRFGNLDNMVAQSAVSRDFVFVGSQTPHNLETGALVLRLDQLPSNLTATIPSEMVISDVPETRIRVQTLQALGNLRTAPEAAGSSIERLVRLRMFLRNQRDLASAVGIVHQLLGSQLPATTAIETTGPNVDPDIDIQVDAIALSKTSDFELKHVTIPELASLHRPFPTATIAGPLLFTTPISGCDLVTRRPVRHLFELTDKERELAADYYVNLRDEFYVAEHLMMWRHLRRILSTVSVPFENILHQNNWLRISMQQYVPVTRVRRNLFGLAGERTAATSLPISNLRTEGASYECSLIAVRPGFEKQGYTKEVRIGSHGIGPYYLGATRAGPYVFAAGEVPIDTRGGRPRMVERSKDLSGGLQNLQYGRIHSEIPLMAQAEFVYELIGAGLASYGCSFADVTHQTVYLVDVGDYPALERMAVLHYGRRFPPTSVVPILGASPFRETLLEIEVTAVAAQ